MAVDETNIISSPPSERHGSEADSPTLPLPPPSSRQELEVFLQAVAATPNARRQDIRDAIGALTARDRVADLLHTALFELPCQDVSRHGVLLSILGELAEPSTVEALERFVWLTDDEVYGTEAVRPPGSGCDLTPNGVLQARAAEMLAWILRTDREDLVTRVIAEHPAPAVRVAAIDAYLFQRDATEASRTLTGVVRGEDAWAIDLVRRVRGMDIGDFDARVAEHEARHGQVPPAPGRKESGDVY